MLRWILQPVTTTDKDVRWRKRTLSAGNVPRRESPLRYRNTRVKSPASPAIRVVEGAIDLPQPLGEGVRADELSTLAGELDYSVFFDRMSISEGRREADTRSCRYEL